MKSAKVLSEYDLTPTNLAKFLESAYLNTYIDDGGERLYVDVDNITVVLIKLDRQRKLLRFFVFYDNDIFQLALANINRINSDYILGRFAISEQEAAILVNYDLPYAGGITPHQLLAVLRTFASVANDAIDEEGSRVQEEPSQTIPAKKVLN